MNRSERRAMKKGILPSPMVADRLTSYIERAVKLHKQGQPSAALPLYLDAL